MIINTLFHKYGGWSEYTERFTFWALEVDEWTPNAVVNYTERESAIYTLLVHKHFELK